MDLTQVAKTFDRLGFPVPSQLTLLDAQNLASAHVPSFPPDRPALLSNIDTPALASHVKDVLLTTYPGDHVVFLLNPESRIETTASTFDQEPFEEAFWLYLPALGEGTSFESFAEIVAHLRAPNGCPWDREQTHESLRKHLLEEAYEA